MINAVFAIGGILSVISILAGFLLVKTTPKEKYISYIPGAVFFGTGLILLLLATLKKIEFFGAGLGGWGIACLFAAAIGFVITSTTDVFSQEA